MLEMSIVKDAFAGRFDAIGEEIRCSGRGIAAKLHWMDRD